MLRPRGPELQLISPVLVPGSVAGGMQAPARAAGRRFQALGASSTGASSTGQPGTAAAVKLHLNVEGDPARGAITIRDPAEAREDPAQPNAKKTAAIQATAYRALINHML
jgi:hypothetical protein